MNEKIANRSSASMKIVAGLGSIDEYERFIQAGADEFFAGYVPYDWSRAYGTVIPLNRREVFTTHVQLGAFSELEILADEILWKTSASDLEFFLLSSRTVRPDHGIDPQVYGFGISQLYHSGSGADAVRAGSRAGL